MEATIDKAGRVVVPAALRERVGLASGPVNIVVHGTGILIEPIATDHLEEVDGVMLVRPGSALTDDDIRNLRLADQR